MTLRNLATLSLFVENYVWIWIDTNHNNYNLLVFTIIACHLIQHS